MCGVTPVGTTTVSHSRGKKYLGSGVPLRTRAYLVDKFVLCHRPSLESHLIRDDHIPMDPRDFFVRTGHVLFPSIWSKQNGKRGGVVKPSSFGRKKTKVPRTEIQLAHDSGLLNRAVFRLDFIEGMTGGFVYDFSVQRRALGKQQFGRHREREEAVWVGFCFRGFL